jgi:hypothetical protein
MESKGAPIDSISALLGFLAALSVATERIAKSSY